MTKFKLNGMMVLRAVKSACSPKSAYIADELRKVQRSHVENLGCTGHPPTTAQVKRELEKLTHDGFLVKSRFSEGYYGFTWTLTEAGNDALKTCIKVQQFMIANDKSKVVSGAAFEGGGGTYTLDDGQSFTFTLEESRSMPNGYPNWGFE